MAIEPNSEEYVVEKDEQVAIQKLRIMHPEAMQVLFKLNKTGACGTI